MLFSITSLAIIPSWKNDSFNNEIFLNESDLSAAHYYSLGLQLSKFLIKINDQSRVTRIGGDWNGLSVSDKNVRSNGLPVRMVFERRFIDDISDLKKLININNFNDCRKYSNHKNLDDGNSAQLDFVILSCDTLTSSNKETADIDLRKNYVQNTDLYNLKNFSGAETWGRWSVGKHSQMQLIGCYQGNYQIELTFSKINEHLTVSVDDSIVMKINKSIANDEYQKYVSIVKMNNCMPILNFTHLVLPYSPFQLGNGFDQRSLGFGIKSILLKKVKY